MRECEDTREFKELRRFAENRASLGGEKQPFCRRTGPYDRMKKLAHAHVQRELDLVKYLKKQRVTSSLLWGLTTPWQRALCRQQSMFLIRDKDEAEFLAYKLPAMRRMQEAEQWESTSSDDPVADKVAAQVRKFPTTADVKYMKRYLDVCTPVELKLTAARQRVVASTFNPDELTVGQQIFSPEREDESKSNADMSKLSKRSKTKRLKSKKTMLQKGKSAKPGGTKVLLDLSANTQDKGLQDSRNSHNEISLSAQPRDSSALQFDHNKTAVGGINVGELRETLGDQDVDQQDTRRGAATSIPSTARSLLPNSQFRQPQAKQRLILQKAQTQMRIDQHNSLEEELRQLGDMIREDDL